MPIQYQKRESDSSLNVGDVIIELDHDNRVVRKGTVIASSAKGDFTIGESSFNFTDFTITAFGDDIPIRDILDR